MMPPVITFHNSCVGASKIALSFLSATPPSFHHVMLPNTLHVILHAATLVMLLAVYSAAT
jgi:hypothetical protein